MSYCTEYMLTVKSSHPLTDTQAESIYQELNRQFIINYALSGDYDNDVKGGLTFYPAHAVPWYSHESDMISLSRLFPNCLFILQGQGEVSDDLWQDYYLNGFRQHAPAIITFDPPDPSLLGPTLQDILLQQGREAL